MSIFDREAIGEIFLKISWESAGCRHDDFYRCAPVNLWRDILPPELEGAVLGSKEGDQIQISLLCPHFSFQQNLVHSLPLDRWRRDPAREFNAFPRLGRWYPQCYAAGLPSIFSASIRPMRVIEIDDKSVTVDCNHPLAGHTIELGAIIGPISAKTRERGGRCASWLEDAAEDGPGIQAMLADIRPDYDESGAIRRIDEQSDNHFYRTPRMFGHIDRKASMHLQNFLQENLANDIYLLDLMAGFNSHLPDGFKGRVTGLGLNDREMRENPSIHERIVHDLNNSPVLPFPDRTFDAVICNLSFEYLVEPALICQNIFRVLKPGGQVIISFSDRWFPSKVTSIWLRLHPFERMGYTLDFLRESFIQLSTASYRNWPRPADDPHQLPLSDPLFIVRGMKPEATS